MKSLYVISIKDAKGAMHSFGIVAPNMVKAVAEAQHLANVGNDAEPSTAQNLHSVDSEVE